MNRENIRLFKKTSRKSGIFRLFYSIIIIFCQCCYEQGWLDSDSLFVYNVTNMKLYSQNQMMMSMMDMMMSMRLLAWENMN